MKRRWLWTLVVVSAIGSVPTEAAVSEKDPVTGATSPACGPDGKCNLGGCASDPDCPKTLGDLPPPTPRPAADVNTTCGGTRHGTRRGGRGEGVVA